MSVSLTHEAIPSRTDAAVSVEVPQLGKRNTLKILADAPLPMAVLSLAVPPGRLARYPAVEPATQRAQADPLGGNLLLRVRGGLAEADDQRDGQRARAHAALVTAAVDDRVDANARLAAHPQRADALGAVHLVRGDRDEVRLARVRVELDLRGALGGRVV